MTDAPSILPKQSPPELDKAQFDAIKADVVGGDQAWRGTVAERWAAYWERQAARTAEVIAINEKMAAGPLCDAESRAKSKEINASLASIKERRLRMAKDIRSGAAFDPIEAELMLRLL